MEQADVTGVLGRKLLPPRVQAIHRERLGNTLDRLWEHRLGLVVGPAGSGKTTLLGQFSARAQVPTIWYRADVQDGSGNALLACLARGAVATFPGIPSDWSSVDDAVAAFEHLGGAGERRALLVVDDLHFLEGTAAEACLERLIEQAPPFLAILMATRRPPRFNLSRLRVSGELLEIGPDDLRFRSWEVEDLFREFYREPLSPEDLAALARRTEGWAAGLQLFHLATQGKPARERQRVIRSLGVGSRLVREYLARNVLDELPAELTGFLLGTCVLGRLTGPLCDQLLERTGSEAVLEELERRHVFTAALDDIGTYRYHEVFRSHLEMLLVERYGEAQARSRYRRAASLLVAAGLLPEALRAYGRAEDWEGAAALLRGRGEELIDGASGWIEGLPGRLVEHDPWLQLASGRRSVASGRWPAALAEYRRAEGMFESTVGADICRRERQALTAWLEPEARPPADWTGVVRTATQREPNAARERALRMPGQDGLLGAGLAALLSGHIGDARRQLSMVAEAAEAGPMLSLGARIASCVAAALAGDTKEAPGLERLARLGEQLGSPWLAGLARAVFALTDQSNGIEQAARFRARAEANGDLWGAALGAFFEGLGLLRDGRDARAPLDMAAVTFHQLGAGVLEAWARSATALGQARSGDPGAREAALHAETAARNAAVPGARALALVALGMLHEPPAAELWKQGVTQAAECGLSLAAFGGSMRLAPSVPAAVPEGSAGSAGPTGSSGEPGEAGSASEGPPVVLRCLGGFSLTVHGKAVDCSTVKPRARSALHLLALHAPRPLHREAIVEALWPGVEPKVGARNLHVVVSTLRHLLEPGVARGASSLLVREGETYRFDLPAGADSDIVSFEAAIADGREAASRAEPERAADAYGRALDLYRGDLLPDDGSAEWTGVHRERYRGEAAAAAHALAELQMQQEAPEAAAVTCERGLRIDRYRDPLWRLRIKASDRAGDIAESARIRTLYAEMLAELGIDATEAAVTSW